MARLLGGPTRPALTRQLGRGAIVLLSLSALIATTPAWADTWSSRDRRHDVDAYRYDPDSGPCGTFTELDGHRDRTHDLTRLSVDNGAADLVLTATFADLKPRVEDEATFHLETPSGRFQVSVQSPPLPRVPSAFFAREPDYPKPSGPCHTSLVSSYDRPCAGLTGTVSAPADTITASIPRRCLRHPPWVRVGVSTQGGTGTIGYADRWARAGRHGHLFLPPYGPRVRAASR